MTMTLENMKEALIESGADKQTIEKLSQAGQRSAQEMKDFLKSLLDFSRKEEFVKKKFLLKPVIEETVRLINKTAKSHQVNIQTDIEEGLELNADDRKIKQVLINLALNAIDAMPKGGTLSFKAYKDNVSSIYIEISDTGHGIPKDKQKHLFTPFFTTKENGTGLGLTIIKEIMDLHQAEISFTSSSQGTIFKLKFN
jgi:signal transduction histidine kinase